MNKLAIITGGTRGFGLAFANELESRGYKVLKVASKNADFNINLTTLEGTNKLIDLIKENNPSLVILNAGFGGTKPFEEYTQKDIIEMQHINGTNNALVLNAFFNNIKAGTMKFIVTTSIAGKLPSPLMGSYSASKAYISNLVDTLNGELISQGVDNLIIDWTPGNVKTTEQTDEVKEYAKLVLDSKEWKVFNKDFYKDVLKKPQNDWEGFVKDSYNKKMERINAKKAKL